MKFGFFSDVHGDLDSLERTLAALNDVDEKICLGDLVGGRRDAECVGRLRSLGLVVLCGNHDLYPPETELLPPELQQYLSELPQCHRQPDFLALHTYFITYGSYRSYKYLYEPRDAGPLLSEFPDRLFFLGHTHVPSLMTASEDRVEVLRIEKSCTLSLERERRYVVNPGCIEDGLVIYDATAQTLEYRLFRVPVDRFSCQREVPLPPPPEPRPWWRLWG